MTKIIGLANSCKECPNRHYFSGGKYECLSIRGSRLNEDSSIPAWCPLQDFPIAAFGADKEPVYQEWINESKGGEIWQDVDRDRYERVKQRDGAECVRIVFISKERK